MFALYLTAMDDENDKMLFTQLYERYERKLYAVARRILGDPTDAEDALQEAMYKIIDHFDTAKKLILKSWDEIEPWCVVIVKNVALSMLRKRGRTVEFPAGWDAPGRDDVEGDVRLNALLALIRSMPVEYRRVLELRLVGEWSFPEIGTLLGSTEGAVKKQFYRGRLLLQKKLAEKGGA